MIYQAVWLLVLTLGGIMSLQQEARYEELYSKVIVKTPSSSVVKII